MDHRKLKGLSFALSFCGFAYQSLMAKTFAIFLQEEVIGFCLSSALFIYGIGLGSKRSSSAKSPLKNLIQVELILMIVGALAPMLVTYLFFIPDLELIEFYGVKLPAGPLMFVFVLLSGSISLGLGYLTGFETPLLFRLREDQDNQSHVNQILAFSYFGALVASVAVPLAIIPKLEIYGSAILTALISGAICLYLIAQSAQVQKLQRIVIAGFAFVLCFALLQQSLQQWSLRIRYFGDYPKVVSSRFDMSEYFAGLADQITVTRHLSQYQAVDIVDGKDENGPFFSLWLNGQFQFDSRFEKSYHEAFLHGALKLSGTQPKRVLILGAGDGLLLRDALRTFAEDTKITMVELDPLILKLAKEDPRWKNLNQNSLANPRVELVTDDAFHYLRESKSTWDAVLLDFPYPYSAELLKLYSLEFYRVVKNRLDQRGFMVFDFPVKESAGIINSTLTEVPFSTIIAYEKTETFVFASNKNISAPSLPEGYQKLELPEPKASLVNSLFKPQLPRMWE